MGCKGTPLRKRSKDEGDDNVTVQTGKCIIGQQTNDEPVSTTKRGRKGVLYNTYFSRGGNFRYIREFGFCAKFSSREIFLPRIFPPREN